MAQIKLLGSLFNRTSVFQSKHTMKASVAFSSASAWNTSRAKHEINATEKVARKPLYTLFAATSQGRKIGKILNVRSSDRTHFQPVLVSYNQSASPPLKAVLKDHRRRPSHPSYRKLYAVTNWLRIYFGLFPRWTCEINPADFGNAPSGLFGFGWKVVWCRYSRAQKVEFVLFTRIYVIKRGSLASLNRRYVAQGIHQFSSVPLNSHNFSTEAEISSNFFSLPDLPTVIFRLKKGPRLFGVLLKALPLLF